MTFAVMICGTASDVGKTRIVTGLCRVFARKGINVAPFKAQNMSLNSYATPDGREVSRSVASQAQAAKCVLEVDMNPILLKPMSEAKSQLVLLGKAHSERKASDYIEESPYAKDLLDIVTTSYSSLSGKFDMIIAEGAGGAAEINLLKNDIVNLPLARELGIPVILVADIERGGVFSSIYGTYKILPNYLREQLAGFIINKMRGDANLLSSGVQWLEENTNMKCLGIVPYVEGLLVDGEDSLSYGKSYSYIDTRYLSDPVENQPDQNYNCGSDADGNSATKTSLLGQCQSGKYQPSDMLDIAVVRFPHLANYTDFDPLMLERSLSLRFVTSWEEIASPDLVILPGSKDTIRDLLWLKERSIDKVIYNLIASKTVILGICAGYQMLGREITDNVESKFATVSGLDLLGIRTLFAPEKITKLTYGNSLFPSHSLIAGYEIHHGRIFAVEKNSLSPFITLDIPADKYSQQKDEQQQYYFAQSDLCVSHSTPDRFSNSSEGHNLYEGCLNTEKTVLGTSLHGIFESDGFRVGFLNYIAERSGKKITPGVFTYAAVREKTIDILADLCEKYVDIDLLSDICRQNARRRLL